MSPEEGVEVVRRILGLEHLPQVVVSTGSLQARIDQWIDIESLRAAKRRQDTQSDYLHPRPELATAYVGPRNEVEQQVAQVVGELLGVAETGVFDNFFADLGGTSLLGTHLVARLRQTFDVELPLRQFYAGPTIADLSVAIASEREMKADSFGASNTSELSQSASVES
jgi:acyl carrier protein